jgi:hypothetical protein
LLPERKQWETSTKFSVFSVLVLKRINVGLKQINYKRYSFFYFIFPFDFGSAVGAWRQSNIERHRSHFTNGETIFGLALMGSSFRTFITFR